MEKVHLMSKLPLYLLTLLFLIYLLELQQYQYLLTFPDSDKDEGSYCPPVKRERTSSFPPPHSGKSTRWLNTELVFFLFLACGVHIDLYAECNASSLLCSSQEQCIHAPKFLPVSNWELWLWARWAIQTTVCFFSQLKGPLQFKYISLTKHRVQTYNIRQKKKHNSQINKTFC